MEIIYEFLMLLFATMELTWSIVFSKETLQNAYKSVVVFSYTCKLGTCNLNYLLDEPMNL